MFIVPTVWTWLGVASSLFSSARRSERKSFVLTAHRHRKTQQQMSRTNRPWFRHLGQRSEVPPRQEASTVLRRPSRLARRIHPHHRTHPRPRRRNLETGTYPQRPRQAGLRPDPGGDCPDAARNLIGFPRLQARVNSPNPHVAASALLSSGTTSALALKCGSIRARPENA